MKLAHEMLGSGNKESADQRPTLDVGYLGNVSVVAVDAKTALMMEFFGHCPPHAGVSGVMMGDPSSDRWRSLWGTTQPRSRIGGGAVAQVTSGQALA